MKQEAVHPGGLFFHRSMELCPFSAPLRTLSVLLERAKMYGPAVRRKMMLAD
jgi:hypothetical protein